MLRTSILLLLFLLFFFQPCVAFAQYSVPNERVNPNNTFAYNIKRVREKLALTLSFSDKSKYNHLSKYLDRRLAELEYVVDNKDLANIQTASQRYSTSAGQLTEFVLKKNLADKVPETLQKLQDHKSVIEPLLGNSFDPQTAEWRFVKYDFDYLESYSKQLTDQ